MQVVFQLSRKIKFRIKRKDLHDTSTATVVLSRIITVYHF